ncbi:MAG TPA: hypothetical protein VND87_06430 [Stellaceae bacterium]|nr:hypothetical protein [Stellaceae bacterium]
MNVSEAVAAAKKHIGDLFAAEPVRDLRMEEFLFDDHLGVWTITLGFNASSRPRDYRIVRVAESDKAVLSVTGR